MDRPFFCGFRELLVQVLDIGKGNKGQCIMYSVERVKGD